MIKVLTYNIHKGFDRYNRDFVLHRIKDYLQSVEVDVVLLQEIQGLHLQHESSISAWPDVSQFEFLADSIWPHYAYGKNAIYRKGHHGNAILSKFNIVEWNNLNLSRFQRASRSLLHGRVEVPGADTYLNLICVHLDLIGFERKRQLRELKSYMDNNIDSSEPIILGGADNQSGTYSYFFGDLLDFATMPSATTRTTRRTPRARGVRRELAGGRHRRHVARLEELEGCVPFLPRSPSGGLTPAYCPIQTPYGGHTYSCLIDARRFYPVRLFFKKYHTQGKIYSKY